MCSCMLIRELTADHVYLACDHTDMRKSIDGVAAVVQSRFQLDPHQPALFLFVDGERTASRGCFGMKPASCFCTSVWKTDITSGRTSRRICWKYLPSSFAGLRRGCPYHSQESFKKFILPIASNSQKLKHHPSSARAIPGFAGLFVV